jgi:hypothetical protein
LNLALAVVATAAAVTLNPLMARTTLIAYLVVSVPHLVFHVLHLENFTRAQALAQTAALAVGVVLPLTLLVTVARLRHSGQRPSTQRGRHH